MRPAAPPRHGALGPRFYWHAVRIYWEDTDAGGVVFYANYLKFFERARTEWLRSLGYGQQALREQTGVVFIVASTQVDYLSPARLDDLVDVSVCLAEGSRSTLKIEQQAWRGDRLLAVGSISVVCVDVASFRPRRIPDALRRVVGLGDPPDDAAKEPAKE